MECIFAWSRIYYFNEKYIGGYNFLVEKGVKFPDELVYFKKEEIPEFKEEQKIEDDEEIKEDSQGITKNFMEKFNFFQNLQKEFLSSLKTNKVGKNMPECK